MNNNFIVRDKLQNREIVFTFQTVLLSEHPIMRIVYFEL